MEAIRIDLNRVARLIDPLNGPTEFDDIVKLLNLDPKCDFRHSDLSGLNFGNSNLSGFDFSFADLSNCDFSRTTLAKTKFEGAITTETKWPPGFQPGLELTPELQFLLQLATPLSFLDAADKTRISEEAITATAKRQLVYLSGVPSWLRSCGVEFPCTDEFANAIEKCLSGKSLIPGHQGPNSYLEFVKTRPYLDVQTTPKWRFSMPTIDRVHTLSEIPIQSILLSPRTQPYGTTTVRDTLEGRRPATIGGIFLFLNAVIYHVLRARLSENFFEAAWQSVFTKVRLRPALYYPTRESEQTIRGVVRAFVETNEGEVAILTTLRNVLKGGYITSQTMTRLNEWIVKAPKTWDTGSNITFGFQLTSARDRNPRAFAADVPLYSGQKFPVPPLFKS